MSLSNSNTLSLKKEWEQKLLLLFMLLVFACSAAFFAFKLKRAIIPDEPAHFILSKHFSTTMGIPPDVPETYSLGYIGHKPFLYYWINGRIIAFLAWVFNSITDWQKLISLRLVSTIYSLMSIVFCFLLAKEVIKNRWWQLLVVFLLTNTLMVVFLSGGVNYDNLTNLCCFAGIYYLTRVFNGKHFYRNSLGWMISISIGTLVKITALPLALIMGLIWILYVVLRYKQINFKPNWDWKMVGLVIIFSLLVFLNLTIYGINIIKYKALTPACNRILTEDQCNLNPFVARAKQLNYPEKKLTYKDVLEEGKPDPAEYVSDYWIYSMLKRIYGIMGHRAYFPDLIITFYRIFILWILCVTIRYWKKFSYTIGSLFIILIFYTLVLLWTNYNAEMTTGFLHVAIQGRYIFPVIGIFYTIIVYSITQIPNSLIRKMTTVFSLTLFFIGGPVMVLSRSLLASWFV